MVTLAMNRVHSRDIHAQLHADTVDTDIDNNTSSTCIHIDKFHTFQICYLLITVISSTVLSLHLECTLLPAEIARTKNVANARIHIDRATGRMNNNNNKIQHLYSAIFTECSMALFITCF